METWSIDNSLTQKGILVLKNRSRTIIRFSERASIDVVSLLTQMELLNVPFAYTNQVKEIYFTIMRDHGDQLHDKIRISLKKNLKTQLDATLIHELAHNVDDHECISDDPKILREKKECAKFLPDQYARKDVREYVAVGFEVFYCGTQQQRSKMRKCNPILYSWILKLHKKYKSQQ